MRGLAAIGASLLLAPGGALAGPSISLNGVPIDGVVSQRFENATVVIDERGNVDILARGYSVSRPEPVAPASPPPAAAVPPRPPAAVAEARPSGALAQRYFLVVQQTEPGMTEYDVSVFLNGRWVREVRSDGDSEPFEITRFLQPGANKVTLVATKRIAGAVRRSNSRDQRIEVILGEGSAGGGTVVLGTPLVTMTRNAAETETFTEEHDLVAR
ncbi:MAG TPA: hypothetical protein VLD85_04470 [Anaeromyxobacteraceae bacterium]|nr:hypothetical protein [Anaeromyxobacteraceae bacterium]